MGRVMVEVRVKRLAEIALNISVGWITVREAIRRSVDEDVRDNRGQMKPVS